MRDFNRPGGFDLIISMWSSFGYFDDPADDLRVLKRCRDNLAPGGALLLDLVGKEIVCRDLQPVHVTEYDDGALLVERPVLEKQMTVYSNQWTLIRDGMAHQAHWHHQLYSGAEIRSLLHEAGFPRVDLWSDLAGSDYDFESERLVVLAR
jgi:SAM-dependent methyltransferase